MKKFEELGYRKETTKHIIEWSKGDLSFIFYKGLGYYSIKYVSSLVNINKDLNEAIQEQLKDIEG